jgi:hypothetical protein
VSVVALILALPLVMDPWWTIIFFDNAYILDNAVR